MNKKEIASYIDHTLLSPVATTAKIEKLCAEAEKYGFASVCVNPCFVEFCAKKLQKTDVKVCTVIGFPLGATTSQDKAGEAYDAVINGADEVDMVINIGAAKEEKYDFVESDIALVVQAAKTGAEEKNKTALVKVILETCYLSDEQIENCCICAKNAGADFVKTSTGFATPKDSEGNLLENGATELAVKLMRQTVGPDFGVKASGGIRNAETALKMINAGATRIGTSSGKKIVDEIKD